MAKVNKKEPEPAKTPKKVVVKKSEKTKGRRHQTVRERTKSGDRARKQRIRKTAGRLSAPLKRVRQTGKREYHLPLPDNRLGAILRKRVRILPKFMIEAGQEIRLVTWPNARETTRLTIAVFVFAVIFATIVGILDYGLDKLFREVIIKK